MLFKDLVDPSDLYRAMEEGLVGSRESADGDLIFNYTDKAVYTPDAWDNPAVRQCRGVIVDADGYVQARPWAKFFNHNQKEAGELDLSAPVEVTDKLDGSLGIIYNDPNLVTRVATRGSFESLQAIHATEWLRDRPGWTLDATYGWTPLVEIIYPANRIVCNYGDRDELVLLGAVHIDTGEYIGPKDAKSAVGWPHGIADTFEYGTLKEALEAEPRDGAEGLCVRFLDENHIIKLKQAAYLRLHKIVTGLSERSVWEAMVEGKMLYDVLADLPDELHDWVRDTWRRLHDHVTTIDDSARATHTQIVTHLRAHGLHESRRDYAEFATRERFLRPYLFMLLDKKNPRPAILKSLKPAGDLRPRVYSEAVA